MDKWRRLAIDEAVQALQADPVKGLTQAAVQERRAAHGYNELKEKKGISVWMMFLLQFREFLVLLLLGAAVIALLLGEVTDAAVIFIVVLINAILGVVQEYKAEKSLAALQTLAAPTAKVVRQGETREIPARELVPGDLVLLDAGDLVPADALLLEGANLQVNESTLTGESLPVEKDASFTAAGPLPPAEQKNAVFMGTMVTSGRARALVTATGMHTEIGRIAGLIQGVEAEQTPLQKKLARLGRQLGLMVLLLCAVIFILGVLRGNEAFGMFLVAVSLAVAGIPEGLPAIVTVVLALGVQRMAARRAIIRKLPAVETLGAATVICSDKTGTLTQNAMNVRRAFCAAGLYKVTGEGYGAEGGFYLGERAETPEDKPHLQLLLTIGALCNDACVLYGGESGAGGGGATEPVSVVGDPTEAALLAAAARAGLRAEQLVRALPRRFEYPFDAERKRMSTVHSGVLGHPALPGEGPWLLTKGAPDLVLERCRYWLGPGGPEELTAGLREKLAAVNRSMSEEALRVLAFALRPLPPGEAPLQAEEAEQDLILIGFMGMIDPPRPEAAGAVELCRRARIKVKMITGDFRETALAVGRELGLAAAAEETLTGAELDQLSQEALEERVERTAIFARVSPEHKLRIVSALQARGEIVAMTGDGVNDAPALKKADIGIAMGRTGTAVAREASKMILADDNFATIVRAVEEGRIIFDNIKKAVHFLLSCNIGEILTILAAILLGWPLPLLPIQILWVNLVTDSLPALALGVEPAEKGTMARPPRPPGEGIFAAGSGRTLAAFGLYIAAITLIAYSLGSGHSHAAGQTMAFATLALSQLVHVFNFRSLHDSVVRRGLFGNRQLLLAVLISAPLQLVVLLHPFLQGIFKVVDLNLSQWLGVVLLSFSTLLFGELWKLLGVSRWRLRRPAPQRS